MSSRINSRSRGRSSRSPLSQALGFGLSSGGRGLLSHISFHFDEESPSFRPHSDLLSPGFKLIYVHPSFSHLVCISVSLTKPALPVGCDAFSQELTHKIMVMFAGLSSSAYSPFLFTFSAVVLIILLHLIINSFFLLGSYTFHPGFCLNCYQL